MITIRTQDRKRLIDCNKIKVYERIDKKSLFELIKDRFEKEKKPIKWLFETGLMPPHNHIELKTITKEDYYELMQEKHQNEYMIYRLEYEDEFLGNYATKERALEVLDEIQRAIIGKIFIPTKAIHKTVSGFTDMIDTDKIEQLPIVYEMPKE